MRQIDIMVENKRLEWEHQLQSVQLQVERRDRDIIKLRETVELRNQEVRRLTTSNFGNLCWGAGGLGLISSLFGVLYTSKAIVQEFLVSLG